MGQFIKLPKSTTDLSSFDLMDVSAGVVKISTTSATTLQVQIATENINPGTATPRSYSISTSTMSNTQRLDLTQNMSKAVQDATLKPNSVPSLVMPSGILVTGLSMSA
jgi:hypothetical protein